MMSSNRLWVSVGNIGAPNTVAGNGLQNNYNELITQCLEWRRITDTLKAWHNGKISLDFRSAFREGILGCPQHKSVPQAETGFLLYLGDRF